VRKQIVLILDSSFLIAFHNKNDVHHAAAAKVMEGFLRAEYGRALLLEYVFLEVVTVLLARRGLAVATAVARILLEAREVEFVPCSEFFQETLETFHIQKETALSFTDAAIVTIARRQKESKVATFDKDFRRVEGVSVIP
jgi:predicted nucleic acid-binding protein